MVLGVPEVACGHREVELVEDALVCRTCGSIVENSASWSLETSRSRPVFRGPGKHSTHLEASLAQIRKLVRELIAAFSLSPSYEHQALSLLAREWEDSGAVRRFGHFAVEAIAALLFLLCRRDHVGLSLKRITETLGISPFACAKCIAVFKRLDPTLAAVHRPLDFVEEHVSGLIVLARENGMILAHELSGFQHEIVSLAERVISVGHETELPGCKESACLAAVWIAFEARTSGAKMLQNVVEQYARQDSFSFNTLKDRRNRILDAIHCKLKTALPRLLCPDSSKVERRRLVLMHIDSLV
jgi:transcription initiation factor TFIIIB Brf1 subunit/transcription initiation factor TFIIB